MMALFLLWLRILTIRSFAMPLKQIGLLFILPVLCSCSWNHQAANPQEAGNMLPSREESVGFFGLVHSKIRAAERASYGLMYGIRDGADSFVYDVQKDYYEDYQK
jgi:hypothetical protein